RGSRDPCRSKPAVDHQSRALPSGTSLSVCALQVASSKRRMAELISLKRRRLRQHCCRLQQQTTSIHLATESARWGCCLPKDPGAQRRLCTPTLFSFSYRSQRSDLHRRGQRTNERLKHSKPKPKDDGLQSPSQLPLASRSSAT